MAKKKQQFLRIGISTLLVLGCTWFVLKGVDLSRLWDTLAGANYWWAVASIPIMIFSHWLRALRWRTMLEPVIEKPSVWNMFSAVMIGYAVNNVIPKGGELLRPVVYSRREKVPLSTVLASIIVERFFFDAVIVLLMIAGVFVFQRADIERAYPWFSWGQMLVVIGGFLLAIAGILIITLMPQFTDAMLRLTVRRFSEPLYQKLHALTESFEQGFAIIKTPSQYLRSGIESIAIWFSYLLPMWMMFYSFQFEAKLGLDFGDATFLFAVGTLAQFTPAPGGIGVYHTLIQTAMIRLYGVGNEEALAYATLTHGLNLIVCFVLGGFFFIHENRIQPLPHVHADGTMDGGIV
jgi:uncharacterized protein (TIRG00374 family)